MKQAIECAALIMWLIGGILLMIGCGKMILEGWPWRMKKELAEAREENEKLRKELEEARDDLRVEKAYHEPQHFKIDTVKFQRVVTQDEARFSAIAMDELMEREKRYALEEFAKKIAENASWMIEDDRPLPGAKTITIWVNIANRIR